MLTINDIINASFNKSNFGGYKTEDVDIFIDEVKESYELLIKKNIEQKEANESLAEENRKLAKKIDLLAKKVEEYREEENEIKNALSLFRPIFSRGTKIKRSCNSRSTP